MNNFARQPASVKIGAIALALLVVFWIASAVNAMRVSHPGITAANAPKAESTTADEHAGHNHAPGEHPGEVAPPAAAMPPETAAPAAAMPETTAPSTAPSGNIPPVKDSTKDVAKLQITDLKVGTGKVAKTGDQVSVNYRGTLTNGKQFDSSYDRGQPFDFKLGGQVIQGWNQGVVGMKVGGKRRLVIPSDLGYGAGGTPDGSIPPNSTLIFEIELLKVG